MLVLVAYTERDNVAHTIHVKLDHVSVFATMICDFIDLKMYLFNSQTSHV